MPLLILLFFFVSDIKTGDSGDDPANEEPVVNNEDKLPNNNDVIGTISRIKNMSIQQELIGVVIAVIAVLVGLLISSQLIRKPDTLVIFQI